MKRRYQIAAATAIAVAAAVLLWFWQARYCPPTPSRTVSCGDATCTFAYEETEKVCCIDKPHGTCSELTQCRGNSLVPMFCDDSSDCRSGLVCCYNDPAPSPEDFRGWRGAVCATRCDRPTYQYVVCDPASPHCPTGQTCMNVAGTVHGICG